VELKTLVTGIFISMAAFSVKAGVGWAYMPRSGRFRARVGAYLAVAAMYAALFAAVYIAARRVNLLSNYETLLPLLQGGVTMHWIAAVLTFGWGLILFGMHSTNGPRREVCGGDKRGYAWLALVIPCPVCLSAVLMSVSCLVLYFPDDAASVTALLYAAFMALATASGILSLVFKKRCEDAERALGEAMMLISAYFILSALVMPQFAEIERIYRMSEYSRGTGAEDPFMGRAAAAAISGLFASGFVWARLRMKTLEKRAAPRACGHGGEIG
jgi:predicted transporter